MRRASSFEVRLVRESEHEELRRARLGALAYTPELERPFLPRTGYFAETLQYSDEDATALYDLLNPWGPSDDFYLALVMEAGSLLDVGCGTGTLLRSSLDAGHAGRLCGVDPDRAMLAVAQRRGDIEWVAGTAASMTFESEFDLAIMTGHAFQFLVDDDELRASLAAIRRALVDGGRFAFETRNPLARAWESWTPANAIEVVDPAGRQVQVSYELESVVNDLVTLSRDNKRSARRPVASRPCNPPLPRHRHARAIPPHDVARRCSTTVDGRALRSFVRAPPWNELPCAQPPRRPE